MQKVIAVILLCLWLVVACNQPEMHIKSNNYFNIKDYIIKQADSLGNIKAGMKKSIVKEEMREEKQFNNVDWFDELKSFMECDINKPAWKSSYLTDSTHHGNEVLVSYKALEEGLPIRNVELKIRDQHIAQLIVHKERNNFYFHSEESYTYNAGSGYEITGRQKVHFLKESSYFIKVLFTN